MAALVRNKTIEDVTNIRDESGRDGMRIVIELKRSAQSEVVLNQLFSHSMLQTTFGVMMLAVVKGRPEILNLKQVLEYYVEHRHDVVLRRTRFDLDKAEARAHVLEGLRVALDNIDAVIELIRSSANPDEARQRLTTQFHLSDVQTQAILTMPLQRLTGLEREKIEEEYKELQEKIVALKHILDNRDAQMQILKDELSDIRRRHGRNHIKGGLHQAHVTECVQSATTGRPWGYGNENPGRGFRRTSVYCINAFIHTIPNSTWPMSVVESLPHSRRGPRCSWTTRYKLARLGNRRCDFGRCPGCRICRQSLFVHGNAEGHS